ncbi:MAG TPA: type 1 glutamine amidotransferase domain-containing protein [Actinomycetota bacterium]|nr:type 1 glutamine amidotransferase domain-containing protein [Actinomycetota bacterium]
MAKVAFIMDDMFEDSEFRVPYDRVKEQGHEPVIIGLESGKQVEGKQHEEKITIEKGIDEVSANDFAAVVIPGGYSPDKIRSNEKMVSFVRALYGDEKPVAAVCHGPWMLAEADIIRGKTVTSWPSIKTDLRNAGAQWVDQEVAEDGNLITSRKPDDLEAFSKALLVQIEQST